MDIQANNYYVAITGSDDNPGTYEQPWRTIQQAANTLVAGDSVLIKTGTYNERVLAQNSGNPEEYIVYSNYQDDVVIIDGSGISWGSSWNGLFDISDKDYIQIIGLKIMNADYGGIWVYQSNHIIIKNNYTYNTFSCGIGVWSCSFVSVEENEVELACNNGEQECISISNSNNCDIFKNNVHHNGPGENGGEGIDVKQGSFKINIYQNLVHHLNERIGIYADAWDSHTYDINIYQNIVHDCGNNGMVVQSEMGGLIEYVTFSNNIVYNNRWDGIAVGSVTASDTVSSTPVKHIKIINNTIFNNGGILDGWGYGLLINNPDAEDIILRNNICSENSAQIAIQQIANGGVVDHNLIFGNNIADATVYGNDSIIGDPLFIDAALYNFNLQNTSPAIDNGSSENAPSVDIVNNNRPYGEGFDIGAYEYMGASGLAITISPSTSVEIYPNPFSQKLNILINGDKAQEYSLQVFNSKGDIVKKVSIRNMKNNEYIMERGNLVPGFYVLSVFADNQLVAHKKMIIE